MNSYNKHIATYLMLTVSAILFVACKPYQQFDKHLSRIIYRNKIQEKYVVRKVKTIHYFTTAINPTHQTIVLLHGFGADAKLQWTKTAKILSKKYNVIFIDLAFHGKTKSSIINNSNLHLDLFPIHYSIGKKHLLMRKHLFEFDYIVKLLNLYYL